MRWVEDTESLGPLGWGQGAAVGFRDGSTATATVSAVLGFIPPSFTTRENSR